VGQGGAVFRHQAELERGRRSLAASAEFKRAADSHITVATGGSYSSGSIASGHCS
jgi:hypothetical protein